jgi:hypothetical protein
MGRWSRTEREYVRIWKKTVVAYFKALSRHSSREWQKLRKLSVAVTGNSLGILIKYTALAAHTKSSISLAKKVPNVKGIGSRMEAEWSGGGGGRDTGLPRGRYALRPVAASLGPYRRVRSAQTTEELYQALLCLNIITV